MSVANRDLIILAGQPLSVSAGLLTWKIDGVAVDLTGYTAAAQVRSTFASASALLDMSTANGKLVLGGAAGTIAFNVSASDTSALWLSTLPAFGKHKGRTSYLLGEWDLELTSPGGAVRRLLQGRAIIVPEVTQ